MQLTFFHYPYELPYAEQFGYHLKLPDLLTLAAMKAFALGRRSKWKDYVDLYFILKDHHTVAEICHVGTNIFGSEFNEKIFRNQLAYFDDMNYSETVEFMPGFEVPDDVIKEKLVDFSLE